MQASLMAEIISANLFAKAGSFVTAGEERTARELQKLPADWIVICNKMLETGDGRSYEVDFIVVADNSVFLLDDKAWSGKIRVTDQEWVREDDGWSEGNVLHKAEYIAKLLANRLRKTIPQLKKERRYFVHGGVVLSSARELPQTTDGSTATGAIFLLSQVCQGLLDLDQDPKASYPIIKQVREQIRKRLYDLSARPEIPAHINNIYTIEDATSVRPGVRLLRAKLIGWNEPRNLMVYDLSTDPLSRNELRLFYMREFKALMDLHVTGYVPEVKDPFAWSDDFLVLPIVPPKGKSLSAYSPPTSRTKLINELRMAAEAFKALATIHQHHGIHRAINPGAIFLQQMSAPFGLMFTNFFAARVSKDGTITPSLDALELEDPYIAPELMDSYAPAAERSDVFSLALVFLKRWSGLHLKTLRSTVADRVVLPDLQTRWPSLPSESIARLTDLFGAIFHPPLDTPRPLSSAVAEQLEEIAQTLE
jgi:hypothetical protein